MCFLKTPPTRIKILASNIEQMATRKNRVNRKNRASRKNNATPLMGGKRRRGSRKGSRRGRRGTRRH